MTFIEFLDLHFRLNTLTVFRAVLDDPDFERGGVTTSFIDERPYLLIYLPPNDILTAHCKKYCKKP